MHQEMNSEAASSGSPLRAAVPPKRAKAEQKVQTNQTMQDLDGIKDELERTKRELDEMTKTMLIMEDDRDMWRRLFEECNKKQGQEIERLRQDNKERSKQMALTTAVEKVIPARSIPRGQSPMELLTPREMSQTTETRLPTATDRVTIPDPSETLGDPFRRTNGEEADRDSWTTGRQQECARFRGDCTLWNDRRHGQSTTLPDRDQTGDK